MNLIQLYTIGFTQKTAQQFFDKLIHAGVKQVIDIRLNNSSQLAGFTKQEDLKYFLKVIAGLDYIHLPDLAPTKAILDQYKKHKGEWAVYEQQFLALLAQRQVENKFPAAQFHQGCLLCSEETPIHCHRRLVAEYLKEKWGKVEIKHIR